MFCNKSKSGYQQRYQVTFKVVSNVFLVDPIGLNVFFVLCFVSFNYFLVFSWNYLFFENENITPRPRGPTKRHAQS